MEHADDIPASHDTHKSDKRTQNQAQKSFGVFTHRMKTAIPREKSVEGS